MLQKIQQYFNSSINMARENPFVPMLEMISRLAMARISMITEVMKASGFNCVFVILNLCL